MKEIGATLKEAREEMGVSLEEVAGDLKLRVSQIEDIESGNLDAFKDVFYLKYFIRDYAKYLGLDYEDMIDEFNEYLFDYTSKISIDDIRKAKKKIDKKQPKEERKIVSPYTLERKKFNFVSLFLFYIIIMIIVFIISYLIFSAFNNDDPAVDDDVIVYAMN